MLRSLCLVQGATDYESAQIIGAQQFEAVYQLLFSGENAVSEVHTAFRRLQQGYAHLPVNTTVRDGVLPPDLLTRYLMLRHRDLLC